MNFPPEARQMYYKIINLRTGEMLDGTFINRSTAEHYIGHHIAKQWTAHQKILEDCKYLNTAVFVSMEDTFKNISYYQGKPYYPPQDRSYHFEVIEETDNVIQSV
jgi:hypothetical protein